MNDEILYHLHIYRAYPDQTSVPSRQGWLSPNIFPSKPELKEAIAKCRDLGYKIKIFEAKKQELDPETLDPLHSKATPLENQIPPPKFSLGDRVREEKKDASSVVVMRLYNPDSNSWQYICSDGKFRDEDTLTEEKNDRTTVNHG